MERTFKELNYEQKRAVRAMIKTQRRQIESDPESSSLALAIKKDPVTYEKNRQNAIAADDVLLKLASLMYEQEPKHDKAREEIMGRTAISEEIIDELGYCSKDVKSFTKNCIKNLKSEPEIDNSWSIHSETLMDILDDVRAACDNKMARLVLLNALNKDAKNKCTPQQKRFITLSIQAISKSEPSWEEFTQPPYSFLEASKVLSRKI